MNKLLVHEKNCWTLTMFEDGTIYLESSFKRKVNTGHMIPVGCKLLYWVPEYVQVMFDEARSFYAKDIVS